MDKQQHILPSAGKEKHGDPVTMKQVRKEFAEIVTPLLLEKIRKDEHEKAKKLLEESGSKKGKKKSTVV